MLSILLYALLIILGVVLKNSRTVSVLLIVYIWIVVSFNTFSSDYNNNLYMYEHIFSPIYRQYEPLFVLLGQLCSTVGLDFTGFRCVVAAIALVFTWMGVSLLTDNRNIALAALLLYPMVQFASGLRSAIGFGISLYALAGMVTGKRPGFFRYMVCILVATLFHYEYIVMLAFVLIKRKIGVRKKIALFFAEIVLLILIFTGVLYRLATAVISHGKVTSWLNISGYNHPSLAMDLFIVSIFAMVFFFISQGTRHMRLAAAEKTDPELAERMGGMAENLQRVADLSLFLVPLLLLSVTFERFLTVPLCVVVVGLSSSGTARKTGFLCRNAATPLKLWEDLVPLAISLCMNLLFPNLIHGGIVWTILQNNQLL